MGSVETMRTGFGASGGVRAKSGRGLGVLGTLLLAVITQPNGPEGADGRGPRVRTLAR